MAEEQVMPQALVLQNENEKMLEKLRNMQLGNLTAKQQKQLGLAKSQFFNEFNNLSYSFFGLSEDQFKAFSANELKVLDKLISRKARPWAIFQILFTFGIPVVGWIIGSAVGFGEGEFNSYLYLYYRKYLKKIYGEEFLPEALKHTLQPKS